MKKLNNKIECKEGKIMGKKKLLAVMLTAVAATVGSSVGTMEVRAEEIVDIVMPMATLGEAPTDLEKVEAKINEITEEKIGVHLIIEPIPFSDLSSQQNLMLSSGDQLDLVLSLWESGISNYVEKGAVIELTDLLEQYGKDILESVGSGVAGGYYSDALYAVPNAESQGHSYGFYARTDVIEELGFTFDIDSVYTIEDLEELFAAYKEKYGDGYYCVAGTSSTSDYFSSLVGHVDAMGNGNGGTGGYAVGALVDCLDKENTTIQNLYATDAYMEYAERMYDWAQKGYYSADAATNTDSGTAQIASGNYLGQFNATEATTQVQVSSACGTEMTPITIVDAFSTTGMYQSVLWGISSNCEYPEKAMEMLNLLYSDAEVVTLLMYGIEGETYEVVEQGEDYQKVIDFPEGMSSMNSPYYVTLGVFGNQNLYPQWIPATLEQYEKLENFNEYVKKEECQSVALKYAFNYSELSSNYSAVNAVISQYSGAIACGAVDPSTQIPAFVKALEDAGINELIAANQEQFDAWLNEK